MPETDPPATSMPTAVPLSSDPRPPEVTQDDLLTPESAIYVQKMRAWYKTLEPSFGTEWRWSGWGLWVNRTIGLHEEGGHHVADRVCYRVMIIGYRGVLLILPALWLALRLRKSDGVALSILALLSMGLFGSVVAAILILSRYWTPDQALLDLSFLLSTAILPMAWVWCYREQRARRRTRTGLCPNCGYDLRAHAPGQRCPECGAVVPGDVERKELT